MKLNIVTLIFIVGLVAVLVLLAGYTNQPWTPVRITGIVIGAPSLVLLILARIQLGRSFSVGAEATALVTHGLYSRIRHPIYVFGGLFIAGFFLYVQRPLWLSAFIVIIPLQISRGRQEEKVLGETFGKEYEDYKAQTWF